MKLETWPHSRAPDLWLGECNDPVDLLLAEHHHHRTVFRRMVRIIERQQDAVTALRTILVPFANDAVLHRADEEETLLPLLSQRTRREDGFGDLLKRLIEDHVSIVDMAVSAAFSLKLIEDSEAPLPERLKADLLRYVFAAEGHLAFENGLLLPIAHQRLTLLDRRIIEQDFRLRRGMVILPATGNGATSSTVSALTH
ncbi:hemerythrin domain-containing protein [Chelatococcus sp. GCM10030263]|uniref:hemerythrin domain-containing protein n=1 Tax=Chelatococcus sp. GCM10030263 TaxID=3273387 RepID=UPI00360D8326